MNVKILTGDCREKLKELEPQSVNCCVTSPPYFGLRDYGHSAQIGAETSVDDYINELVAVFQLVDRVIRNDGLLFVNIGDSYRKSERLMVPARTAIALQKSGWILRDEIVWNKPNAMPESVRNRTVTAHEMIYMFSKSKNYYFDFESIREPAESKRDRGRPNGAATYEKFGKNTSCGVSPDGLRRKRSVWDIPTAKFKGAHFAVFPPALVEPCILAGAPVGGTILDPFAGSGTTGVVATRLQRKSILIELNETYAEIATKRINENSFFGQSDVFS